MKDNDSHPWYAGSVQTMQWKKGFLEFKYYSFRINRQFEIG